MNNKKLVYPWLRFAVVANLLVLFLSGCGGSDGADGAEGPPGPVRTTTAESLDITIDNVSIDSPPVVEFTVKDESGIPLTGLKVGSSGGNLRFNIAKLTPGTNGDPSAWQNYINNNDSQGTYERNGTLEDLGNGQFKYTFATDITDPTKTGGVSYDPTLTHRVAIQVDGFSAANPTYDFRPDGAAITVNREIVKTDTCNNCHNKLAIHGGGRIETKYCVTCHNPGSIDPDSGNTVDFKVMVHKIHRGEELPSVVDGIPYQIIGFGGSVHDFSTVVFPQDIRNCTTCHDGSDPATPQGDNWKTQMSIQACGSCHDDIDFSKDGSPPPGANDPDGHPGGIVSDNSECVTCHATGRIAGSVAESHVIPEMVAAAKFEYNLIDVTGDDTPVIEFSITDPTNSDAPYDITDAAFTTGGGVSRLAILIGWDASEFNNAGNGADAGGPISINPVDACDGTDIADWVCTGPASGVYTLTKQTALPVATGTGRVGIEGHPAADDGTGAFTLRVPVKSVVKDWSIDGGTVTARRQVVDIAKCDNCHQQVSLHGGNRNDEPQLCVMCHNPNATDINVRPADPADALDGKVEESIDFKRLIHGIHAAAETNYDASEGHGFREKGLVVYGFGGSEHDFSHVRFPGILQDCETCHLSGTYELAGTWELPTLEGILGSTINTGADLTVPTDDLNISPTAAVCTSCHDGALTQAHMENEGAVFNALQTNITDYGEVCAVCHGTGKLADVEVVHGIQ